MKIAAAVELVPALAAAGVVSLKIEGRLKGPEYVAATVAAYRKAVDVTWAAMEAADAAAAAAAAVAAGGGDDAVSSSATSSSASTAAAAALPDYKLDAAGWRELAQVFARGQGAAAPGLTRGFLEGTRHQSLVRGRAPRHRGVFLGEVEGPARGGGAGGGGGSCFFVAALAAPLRRGDGVVLDAGAPGAPERGGVVHVLRLPDRGGAEVEAAEAGARVEVELARGGPAGGSGRERGRERGRECRAAAAEPPLPAAGQLLWRTRDPELEARLRASYESVAGAARRRAPVAAAVAAARGAPLRVELADAEGRLAVGESDALVGAAAARPLRAEDLEKAIGIHLGTDSLAVAGGIDLSRCDLSLDASGGGGIFLPAGEVKKARRRAAAALLAARRAGPAGGAPAPGAAALAAARAGLEARGRAAAGAEAPAASASAPTLRVLCRTRAQVDAALELEWLDEIILDFLEVHGLADACAAVRAAGRRLVVATPRVLKPGEGRLWRFYVRLGADALLVRSAGLLRRLKELGGAGAPAPEGCDGRAIPLLEGDFSLNAANALSADLLLAAGLARLALTHDCDAEQLAGVARALGPARASASLEAIVHTNVPLFHTEHCLFARQLSGGESYLDCGRPCEKHALHVRAPDGRDSLVVADEGCRNTVFEGAAQSALDYLPELVAAGFGCFRVELVDAPAAAVAPLLEGYRAALGDAAAAAAAGGAGGLGRREAAAAEARREALWRALRALPDANGRAQGCGAGSFAARAERARGGMKATAAALRRAGGGRRAPRV
jgi:putative protease